MNHIEKLNPTDIVKYGDDTAKFLFNLWERERGKDVIEYARLAEYYMRFSGRLEEDLAPMVLACGPQTLTAELVGPVIAKQPPDVLNEALGKDYRRFAGSIYHDALINFEPMHDLVSSVFTCEGRSYELVYTRAVFPIQNHIGIKQAILYTQKHHVQLKHHQQDPEGRRDGSQQATGREGLYQDRSQAVQAPSATL